MKLPSQILTSTDLRVSAAKLAGYVFNGKVFRVFVAKSLAIVFSRMNRTVRPASTASYGLGFSLHSGLLCPMLPGHSHTRSSAICFFSSGPHLARRRHQVYQSQFRLLSGLCGAGRQLRDAWHETIKLLFKAALHNDNDKNYIEEFFIMMVLTTTQAFMMIS